MLSPLLPMIRSSETIIKERCRKSNFKPEKQHRNLQKARLTTDGTQQLHEMTLDRRDRMCQGSFLLLIFLALKGKTVYNVGDISNTNGEVDMNANLKQYIRYNRDTLVASKKDLKAIFDIMFYKRDNILCESSDGFRIHKQTYGQICDRILSAAGGLYEKIGATHSYVALEMDNSPEWIVAFWAILASGNKPYLVNMRYPQSLSNAILKTLNITYTLCAKESELDTQSILIGSVEGSTARAPEAVFEDEIAFSSSATSMNEVVCFYRGFQISEQILNFEGIIKECPRIAKHYKGSLKQLAFLPFYHVFGLFAVYFWFTFFGRTLVFLRDLSADTILQTVRRHQVTHIFAVPMLWHTVEKQLLSRLKEQGEKKQKKFQRGLKLTNALQNLFPSFGPELSKRIMKEVTSQLFGPSVYFCINGGSYLRDSAMALLNGIGYCTYNGYGMSEIGITSVELRSRPKDRNKNTIGHPFQSVEYRLDEKGCLQVRGSSLCVRKLINGREQTLEGWFHTGDKMTCENGYYTILGREGDLVIGENGENINPDTVEKLFLVGSAKMLSVLGLPGQQGQELSMVVQLSPYATEQTITAIREEVYGINATLPTATAIRKFYFTRDELAPPTAVKVSRTQLQKKIAAGEITLVPFSECTAMAAGEEGSPLMQDVKRIIAKVLELPVEKVESGSHIFFDLGASSIQYFTVLSELSSHFSITGYDKDDKYCYTPKDICEYIERRL